MTLPDERYRAVLQAQEFLQNLMDSRKTPRVPKVIRQQARSCLRHYPDKFHMDMAATMAPHVFETKNRIDSLTTMVYGYSVDQTKDAL